MMKKYMKCLCSFILLFVLSASVLFAQNAVTVSGGEANGNSGSVSYSIGQTFYSTNVGSNGQVSEGVLQPYEIYDVTEVQSTISDVISLSAFPNPTSDFLTLRIDGELIDGLSCAMFDISGKEIMQLRLTSSETRLDVQQLSSATYFVRVTKGKDEVKTFKIVKN